MLIGVQQISSETMLAAKPAIVMKHIFQAIQTSSEKNILIDCEVLSKLIIKINKQKNFQIGKYT